MQSCNLKNSVTKSKKRSFFRILIQPCFMWGWVKSTENAWFNRNFGKSRFVRSLVDTCTYCSTKNYCYIFRCLNVAWLQKLCFVAICFDLFKNLFLKVDTTSFCLEKKKLVSFEVKLQIKLAPIYQKPGESQRAFIREK